MLELEGKPRVDLGIEDFGSVVSVIFGVLLGEHRSKYWIIDNKLGRAFDHNRL